MASAAEVREMMQKRNSAGVSMYGHLTDVLATLLDQKPADALSAFESISLQLKTQQFTLDSAVPPEMPATIPETESSDVWHVNSSALLKAPEEEEDTDGMTTPNLLEDAHYLEWAGLGFSAEESYRVYVSLSKLQQTKKLATVRFFGKVLGTGADYYIAEGKYLEDPEPDEDAPDPPVELIPAEERGSGCNELVYFATNDPGLPWTELPQVTPAQISGARLVRKFFTGDLQADVRAFPPFPGKEKEYLRAQIARIGHATILCPKGKFMLEEDADPPQPVVPVPEEDYVPLKHADMSNPANWCRYYMGILNIGRCTNLPLPEEEEEEGEEPKAKGPEPEPEVPALQPVSAGDWSFQQFFPLGAGAAVAVARSTCWPGAIAAAVMKADHLVNFYAGYGHEALSAPFVPLPPPPIEQEPNEELVEQKDEPLEEENKKYLAEQEAKLLEGGDEEEEAGEE